LGQKLPGKTLEIEVYGGMLTRLMELFPLSLIGRKVSKISL
jgi:hypothetical protein